MKILTSKKYNEMTGQIKNLNTKVMELENRNTRMHKVEEINLKLDQSNKALEAMLAQSQQEYGELYKKNGHLYNNGEAYRKENTELQKINNNQLELIQKLKSSNGGYRSSAQKKQKKIEALKKELAEVTKQKENLTKAINEGRVQPTPEEYDKRLKFRKNKKEGK